MQNLRLVVPLIVLVCAASSGSAKVQDMYLEEVVSKSDLIIIGETVGIVETAGDAKRFNPTGTATIRVERAIKGRVSSREIDVIYQPCIQAVSATYSLCERCVLFLLKAERSPLSRMFSENPDGKYITAGGYLGKIPIGPIDNMVIVLFKGDQIDQPLEQFLHKVERLIKGDLGRGEKGNSTE